MAAYAEGLNVLKNANAGKQQRTADAETSPLEHPERYQYDFPLGEITELWRRGSVIGSPVAPLIKVTGNSRTYARMIDDMDFDAGRVLSGERTLAQAAGELVHASGRYLDFSNRRRPHTSLDGATPDQVFFNPLPLRSAA